MRNGIFQRTCSVVLGSVVFIAACQPSAGQGRTWTMRSDHPAKNGENACLVGNGIHGSHVLGIPGKESITLVHERLWTPHVNPDKDWSTKTADKIDEVRKQILKGNYGYTIGLERGLKKQLDRRHGTGEFATGSPHPAFDLKFNTPITGKVKNYLRTLDYATGEARITYDDDKGGIVEEVFASRVRDLHVVRFSRTQGQSIDLDISLHESPILKGAGGRLSTASTQHHAKRRAKSRTLEFKDNVIYYHQPYSLGHAGYEGVTYILPKGGKLTAADKKMSVKGADEVIIFTKLTYLEDAKKPMKEKLLAVIKSCPEKYSSLKQEHAKVHGDIFRRCVLDLGAEKDWETKYSHEIVAEAAKKGGLSPAFLEAVFAAGRYHLLASSGDYPPALQGIWGPRWNPPWQGGFVFDSNLYLQTMSSNMGNMPECSESYMKFIEMCLPNWQRNAKNHLGTRGYMPAHYMYPPKKGIKGKICVGYPWSFWPTGGAWAIRPFYEYYLCHGDEKFLRERLLPIFVEQARLYEDYVVKGENGKYDIIPAMSPENRPSNVRKGGVMPPLYNTTHALGAAREHLKITADLCEKLGLHPEGVKKWRHIRANLYEYRINKDGALAEWCPPKFNDSYGHRHTSHLYCLYPSHEMMEEDTPKHLVKAAQKAVDIKTEYIKSKGGQQCGHGIIYRGMMGARVKDPANSLFGIDFFAKNGYFYDFFYSSHDPKGHVFCGDVSGATPQLLMEMLVRTYPGVIELMPAWSEKMPPTGMVKGVATRVGASVDIQWAEGKITQIKLYPKRDELCELRYAGKIKKLNLKKGKTQSISGEEL